MTLAPGLGGDDAEIALSVDAGAEASEHPVARLRIQCRCLGDVPHDLDARRRRVHVLTAGAAGPRGSNDELTRRYRERSVDRKVVHGTAGSGWR